MVPHLKSVSKDVELYTSFFLMKQEQLKKQHYS